MNLLIDTHTLLWFLWNDATLSATARTLITNSANRKLVSVVSCWEIAIKVSVGKLNLGESARDFLHREIVHNNFEILQVTFDHATMVESLFLHHRDPFDRLLVAQAMVEKAPIISVDAALDPYPIQRLW